MKNRPSADSHTPVLIVGAGPVGLALALDLASRNIACTLIDKGDGVVRMSKMGLVSVRSMEFCRRWGIAEDVRHCGFPADYPLNQVFCTSLNGHHIATIEYPCINDEPTHGFSPEKKQRCPQLWFDPILARAVSAHPLVDVRYGRLLASFDQDEAGVTAELVEEATGERQTIRSDYLVGCDGAGSTVRKALGIELEGDPVLSHSVGIYFTAPQLIRHHRMGPAERYMLVGEEGTWGHLTVVDASDIWRLTVLGSQDKVENEDFDPHYWLRRCFGRDDVAYSVTAVLPWRRSRLVARRYADRRVLIAGDACHVMAPNGGYGMNTGLGDAVDLGWKLAGVIDGWAHPDLLDSYEQERRPVGQRNVNAAATNFSTMAPRLEFTAVESDGADGDRVRRRLQSDLVEGTRPEWEVHGINLGYRYDRSAVIVDDGTPQPPDEMSNYRPTSRPGHRAPHVPLAGGGSTIDLFGHGFVLLEIDATGAGEDKANPVRVPVMEAAAAALGVPLTCHGLQGAAARALYDRRYVLVRPDGHVAWRGHAMPDDADAVLRQVCGWPAKAPAAGLSDDAATRRPGGGRFSVRVVGVQDVATDIRLFTLQAAGAEALPAYDAGAHIEVETPSGAVRQYSLFKLTPTAGCYQIAVKKEPASRGGSASLHEQVRTGTLLQISPPRNQFALATDEPHVLLLAGGIGITPLLAMALQLKAQGRPFALHYFARSVEHAAFGDLFGRPDWAAHVQVHLGFDAVQTRRALRKQIERASRAGGVYICGPGPFMETAVELARDHGLARIHTEYFAAPAVADATADIPFKVRLRRSGIELDIPPGRSIVSIMGDSGLRADVSCEQGVCGTCLTRVLSGEPEHRDAYLTEEERASGEQMMICVSRARGGSLDLDL